MASFQALSSTNADLVLVRAGSACADVSDPVQTDLVVPTGVAGVFATAIRFRLRPPTPVKTGRLFVIGSFAYEITVGGGAGSTGRARLTVLRNGLAIAGVAAAVGATQSFAGAGGPFREVLAVAVPDTLIDADDTLEVAVQYEIVNAVAGNATVRLHHAPAGADPFPVEMPQVGEATEEFQGLATDAGALLAVQPTSAVQVFSDPVSTAVIVAGDGVPGVVDTLSFELRPRTSLREQRVDIVALLRWSGDGNGGAASTGRLQFRVSLNGTQLVAPVNMTTRALDAPGGPFDEVAHLVIPALTMDLDDVLTLDVQVALVAAGAAGNATVTVHHDPNTAGEEMFFELIPLP